MGSWCVVVFFFYKSGALVSGVEFQSFHVSTKTRFFPFIKKIQDLLVFYMTVTLSEQNWHRNVRDGLPGLPSVHVSHF